ncbi:MAG: sensor histidine kinase [bacterium]
MIMVEKPCKFDSDLIYIRRVFLAILAVFCIGPMAEAAPISLPLQQDDNFYISLKPYTVYYEDTTRQLTIKTIQNKGDLFSPIDTPYVDFGLTESRIWLHFSLTNEYQTPQKWRIDTGVQYIQEIDIFSISDTGTITHLLHHTEKEPFNQRRIKNMFLMAEVNIAPLEKQDFYIAYRSSNSTYLPIAIGTPQGVVKHHYTTHFINALLNGALLAFIVFAIALGAVIKWRLAIGFSLYILSGMLFVLHADGYSFIYLWPNHPEFNEPFNLFFMILMSIFGLSFSRYLFDFENTNPGIDRFIKGAIIFACILAFLSLFMIKVRPVMIAIYSYAPIGAFLHVLIGIVAIRQKLLGAIPYLIGALFVFSSMVYAALAHTIPGYFNMDATLDYGHITLIVESMAFTIAIVLRLIGIQKERDTALRAELSATQEKLQIADELHKTQEDYITARKLSDQRRAQLTSVSHDLQQPLLALRTGLENIDTKDEKSVEQMHLAFDYLEKLARDQMQLDEEHSQKGAQGGRETFPISAILDNVYQMFLDEARRKGIDLHYKQSTAPFTSDPIVLMRAISNLVSNAVKHTSAGRIDIFVNEQADKPEICIKDSGHGMSEEELQMALQPNTKGPHSTGYGLGLAIVQEQLTSIGMQLEITSQKGEGTECRIF